MTFYLCAEVRPVTSRRPCRGLAVAGLALVLAGCGSADSDGDSGQEAAELFPRVPNLQQALRDAGLGDYLGTTEPYAEAPLTPESPWLRQDFAPETGVACADGGPFFTAYRAGSTNNLAIVLDGGGACWNDLSCAIGTARLEPGPPGREGILSLWSEVAIRDWHTVFVPYCDASVFTGDNIVQFPRAGERIFHGLRNLSAALTVAAAKVPDPDRILVTGQSAGSFGSIFAIGPARVAFPDAEMFLFADSGPGVTNPENELQLADFRANWRFTDRLPCASCDPQFVRFVGWMLQNDPKFVRAGVFSFTEDAVIRQFLGTIQLFSYDPMPPDEYGRLVRSEVVPLERRFLGRFEYFLAPGTTHVVSWDDELFEGTEVDGLRVRDWFNGLIRRNADWRSVDHGRP